MERYYQKEIECASQEQIKAWQDERLVRQVRHVWDKVPYYRAKMEEKGVTPEDIHGRDDLYKLPFLSKADLRDAYPFGLLAEPLEKCVRIHSTSGTTGKRVVAFYTKEDIDLWNDCCARALAAAGAGPEDVCQVAYGYGLFTGGFGLNGGSQKLGCLTLPHVLRQYRPAAAVHGGSRLDDPLLHAVLRSVSGRIHPRARAAGQDPSEGRYLRRGGLERADAAGYPEEPRHQGL